LFLQKSNIFRIITKTFINFVDAKVEQIEVEQPCFLCNIVYCFVDISWVLRSQLFDCAEIFIDITKIDENWLESKYKYK
tara:strand:+ start:434 stop:670 length:237 start_codon:yes stop_codon:yes gene_type:complete